MSIHPTYAPTPRVQLPPVNVLHFNSTTIYPWSSFRNGIGGTGRSEFVGLSNTRLWSYATPTTAIVGEGIYTAAAIDSMNNLYFNSADQHIYSLAANGTLRWSFPVGTGVSSPALGHNDTIYISGLVGTTTNYLYAFSSNGLVKWTYMSTGYFPAVSSPVVNPQTGVIYFGLNQIIALPAVTVGKSATALWVYPSDPVLGMYFYASPTLGPDGTLYAGCANTFLYALDSNTGLYKWHFPAGYLIVTTPAVANGAVYVGAAHVFYSLSTNNGTLNWMKVLGGSTFSSPAVDYTGKIYIGCADGAIYALYPNGSIAWTYQVAVFLPIASSPAVDRNNNIYFSGSDGFIYSLYPSGSLRWMAFTDNYNAQPRDGPLNFNISASVTISTTGAVFVGSSNGYFYCFGGLTPGSPTLTPVSPGSTPGTNTTAILASVLTIVLVGGCALCCYFIFVRIRYPRKLVVGSEATGSSGSHKNSIYAATVGSLYFYGKSSPSGNFIDPRFNDGYSGYNGNILEATAQVSPLHPEANALKTALLVQDRRSTVEMRESILGLRLAAPELMIKWAEIASKPMSISDAVLGHGSFGTVIRAVWRPDRTPQQELGVSTGSGRSTASQNLEHAAGEVDVAIKVISRLLAKVNDESEFHKICALACEEAKLVFDTEQRIGNSRHIIKIYGVAEGYLSDSLIKMFRFHPEDEVVGIIMRLETGGSLETLLYKKKHIALTTVNKIRLLVSIAQGLSEIHAVGVVHGDIKPDNILLSPDDPPEARLADFGMARVKQSTVLNGSTLEQTHRLRGTPIYCAPEMLVNPFEHVYDNQVAQASRKTDMYAFGLLSWSVLTRLRPLADIKTEAMLCSKVHIGYRPNLFQLPADTPQSVTALIAACWDKNRSVRKSAAECFSILLDVYRQLAPHDLSFNQTTLTKHKSVIRAKYDVYIMECANQTLAQFLATILLQRSYSCWLDNGLDHENGTPFVAVDKSVSQITAVSEMDNLIYVAGRSTDVDLRTVINDRQRKAVILSVNGMNQHGGQVAELKLIVSSPLIVPVLLFTEMDRDQWMNADIRELCALPSVVICDVSDAISGLTSESAAPAALSVNSDGEVKQRDNDMEAALDSLFTELIDKLEVAGCSRSLK